MESSGKTPSKNMERVARALFQSEGDAHTFLNAVLGESRAQSAVVWLRNQPAEAPFECAARPEWLPSWIDVAAVGARPGKLASHEQGDIYCLDLSSTFACAALSEVSIPTPGVVDVCAAPGGKGILAYRYLQPAFTVANEVIRKRTAQLISNYKRCAIDPSVVVSYDPKDLAEICGACADVVIVDAPCSGQSLVVKDMAAPGAFHPATISMNERRQRRILAHSQALVAPGGYLLYSTCTFSREENEDNIEWFLGTFPEFQALPVRALSNFSSAISAFPSYRLWPHQGFGAGSYCCLLKRTGQPAVSSLRDCSSGLWTLWRSAGCAGSGQSASGSSANQHRSAKRDKGKGRTKERRWRFQPGSTDKQ